ncbi:MAG: hypothetical protein WCA16_18845 [Candidatus Sulfotelmatobacter sp.]
MCESRRRTSRPHRSLIFFVIILLSARVDAGDDYFVRAKAFLRAIYPELKSKNLRVTVFDDASFASEGGLTTFSIGLEERIQDRLSNKESLRPCVSAFFSFPNSSDDRIFKLAVSGPFVNESKTEGVRQLIDSHPEWSDSQVIQALEEKQPQYGPGSKEALLETVPLRALEPFLGKVRVLSTEFELRSHAQLEEKLPSAELQWVIHVEGRMPGRKPLMYYLAVEPFGGKLVLLGRTPPKF